jgi:amino-acid N-acetyltransferase
MATKINLRLADIRDVPKILSVLSSNHEDVSLFQQSEGDIKGNVTDFILAEDEKGNAVGCAALHRYDSEIAEVSSVSVLPSHKGLGIGNSMVEECVNRALSKNIGFLWLATSKPNYFMRYGFRPMPRNMLPIRIIMHKIGLLLKQPIGRWIPAIFGRHKLMKYDK